MLVFILDLLFAVPVFYYSLAYLGGISAYVVGQTGVSFLDDYVADRHGALLAKLTFFAVHGAIWLTGQAMADWFPAIALDHTTSKKVTTLFALVSGGFTTACVVFLPQTVHMYAPENSWIFDVLLVAFSTFYGVASVQIGMLNAMNRKRKVEYLRDHPPGAPVPSSTTLFAHGLHVSTAQAFWFTERDMIGRCSSTEYLHVSQERDSTPFAQAVRIDLIPFWTDLVAVPSAAWPKLDIGGAFDIRRFEGALVAQCQFLDKHNRPDEPVVIVGFSRGTATVIGALCKLATDSVQLPEVWACVRRHVRGVLLIAPMATVDDAMMQYFGHRRWLVNAIQWVYSRRWLGFAFDPSQPSSPLACVPRFPGNIPLAIVASRGDRTIPLASTERLIAAFRAENAKRALDEKIALVEPLILQHSRHEVCFAPWEDRTKLIAHVHALYRIWTQNPVASDASKKTQ
jgi:hypothetical protein